jgi:hypothetical protein
VEKPSAEIKLEQGMSLSRASLDRILLKSDDFVEFINDARVVNQPDDFSAHPWIYATDLRKIEDRINTWTWETMSLPSWVATTIAEGNWASKQTYKQIPVAWVFGGNRAIIQAPYSLTLSKRLGRLNSKYFYSQQINGWVVENAETDSDELRSILDAYDITVSPKLNTVMEGRGEWKRALKDLVQYAKDEGFELPSDFKSGRKYKPHQEEAVLAMAYRGDCNMLADQVGLGKGGEFVGGGLVMEEFLKKTGDTTYPTVVSVTKSMKHEIAEEILKWKHNAQIQILEGTKQGDILPGTQYIILNHDLLAKRLPDILDAKPRSFIADESHVFKSETAVRTKAAIELVTNIRKRVPDPYVVMASGTPFLNKPAELWSVLCILGMDKVFGEYAMEKVGRDIQVRVKTKFGPKMKKIWPQRAFEMRWCGGHHRKYKDENGIQKLGDWEANGATNTAELNKLLVRHTMVRRRKADVIDPLPELREQLIPIVCEDDEMVERYEQIKHEFADYVVEKAIEEAEAEGYDEQTAIRSALNKLVNGEQIMQMTAMRQHVAQMKTQGTVDWIHRFMAGDPEITGGDPTRRKLIVYAYHREPQTVLANHPELQQYGVVTILSAKDQKQDSIQSGKKLFQEDPDTRLIICSMAAREGHTLTAAKDVYLHEIPFVPSWIVQMAGRCWARFSELYEPHEAYLHYAVVMGTIDADLVRMVRLKKQRFDAVIDGEGQDDETMADLNNKSVDILAQILETNGGKFTLAR